MGEKNLTRLDVHYIVIYTQSAPVQMHHALKRIGGKEVNTAAQVAVLIQHQHDEAKEKLVSLLDWLHHRRDNKTGDRGTYYKIPEDHRANCPGCRKVITEVAIRGNKSVVHTVGGCTHVLEGTEEILTDWLNRRIQSNGNHLTMNARGLTFKVPKHLRHRCKDCGQKVTQITVWLNEEFDYRCLHPDGNCNAPVTLT